MANFLLVHGAWHGGWCWRDVVPQLTGAGHRVHAVTLTGVGERMHLMTPAITLETHITDVANAIEMEEMDQIVLVVVTSSHRGESFQACEFLMDYLKTQAPFWKKERTPEGERWVDARVADDAALERWGIESRNT